MKPSVYLTRCTTYEASKVREAVEAVLSEMGGMERFVRPGMKVVIKPNMILAKKPEEAATTHPALVSAVAALVKQAGAVPVIVESSFGPYTPATMEKHYRACGLKKLADEGLAELNYDASVSEVQCEDGLSLKRVSLLKPIAEADAVISLSKLKTHAFMTYTGAVKNLFGTVAGLQKGAFHMRFPDSHSFADALIDICLAAKPALHIMDAVIGMEGEGPTAGTPREIGFIGASVDPFALDLAAASVITDKPRSIPMIDQAMARGLSPKSLEDVDFPMERPEAFTIRDFKFPKTEASPTVSRLRNSKLLKPYPAFDKKVCVGCGDCSRACPAAALTMVDKRPQLDMNKCIRCFCCHEGCMPKAVRIRRNRLAGLVEAGLGFLSFFKTEVLRIK